jgi:predicted alpha/beta hydrolase family esterase
MHYVIIPGINGSGQAHWQSVWQDAWGLSATRIAPASWDEPDLDDWCLALDRATDRRDPEHVVLVAHSLGCLTAAYWLRERRPSVRGAFLVAPPDVTGPEFPAEAASFAAPEAAPIQAPGLLLTSDDDPYCTPQAARRLAAGWAVGHIRIGEAGHVNAASGHGAWPAGRMLLDAFTAGLGLIERL